MSVTINGTTGISKTQPSSAPWLTGMIIAFGNETAPDGWLSCDGSAVSRTTYAGLFAKVGTKWGDGDGTTTFNVPDMRGFAPVGTGTNALDIAPGDPTVGKFTGPAVGDLRRDQMQQITGTSNGNLGFRIAGGHSSVVNTGALSTSLNSSNTSGSGSGDAISIAFDSANSPNARTGTTTHGPEAGVLYCIKT